MSVVQPVSGNILVAEPFLGDPNFERSVVLLCEHNQIGSFGLVLNQLSNLKLADLTDGVILEFPVYVGGPVEYNTLHFVHCFKEVKDSIDLGNGVYWGGDFEEVKSMINMGKIDASQIRFFIGYSGWEENQLSGEINRNTWIVAETDAETIFEENIQEFWRMVMRSMGGEYKVMSNYPIDPRLN